MNINIKKMNIVVSTKFIKAIKETFYWVKRSVMNKFKYIFNKWNNLEKCPKCKSTKTTDKNIDRLDGYGSTVLEYDLVCAKCGHYINHWAYGYMQEPETKIAYLKWIKDCYTENWFSRIKEIWMVLWL
jgi:hypothetical protein